MFDLKEHVNRLVRMSDELANLDYKISCIHSFKLITAYADMTVTDQSLQDFQLNAMESYSSNLTKRVTRLANKIKLHLEKSY